MKIAHLKITLLDVKPTVVRRLQVPLGLTLADLHTVIQHAMPWHNCHMYMFEEMMPPEAGADTVPKRWSKTSGAFDAHFGEDARKATLEQALAAIGKPELGYIYDFGDEWLHPIEVRKITDAVAGETYPQLVEVKGRCPPEDCGGPWGYEDLLKAIADPDHDDHDEKIEWVGEDYDPKAVDVAGLTARVAALGHKPRRAPRKAAAKGKAQKSWQLNPRRQRDKSA